MFRLNFNDDLLVSRLEVDFGDMIYQNSRVPVGFFDAKFNKLDSLLTANRASLAQIPDWRIKNQSQLAGITQRLRSCNTELQQMPNSNGGYPSDEQNYSFSTIFMLMNLACVLSQEIAKNITDEALLNDQLELVLQSSKYLADALMKSNDVDYYPMEEAVNAVEFRLKANNAAFTEKGMKIVFDANVSHGVHAAIGITFLGVFFIGQLFNLHTSEKVIPESDINTSNALLWSGILFVLLGAASYLVSSNKSGKKLDNLFSDRARDTRYHSMHLCLFAAKQTVKTAANFNDATPLISTMTRIEQSMKPKK